MSGQQSRNEELAARIRNNIRVEARIAWSLLAVFLIVSALFLGILKFHMPMQSTGFAALAVLLIWVAIVFRVQRTTQPVALPYDEKVLRRTIDAQHRRWRWIYTFVFIAVGALAAMIVAAASFPVAGHILALSGLAVIAVDFAFFAIVAAFQVCLGPSFFTRTYRRALNDEHTRALQQSAALFGYLLCVILMCAVLAILAFRPQWGLVIMPGVIAVCVILPGLYFLILQWRSGRDG